MPKSVTKRKNFTPHSKDGASSSKKSNTPSRSSTPSSCKKKLIQPSTSAGASSKTKPEEDPEENELALRLDDEDETDGASLPSSLPPLDTSETVTAEVHAEEAESH